jgi:hypothetical protein
MDPAFLYFTMGPKKFNQSSGAKAISPRIIIGALNELSIC